MADVGEHNKTGLIFRLADGGKKLQAVYTPLVGEKAPVTLGGLKQALIASGYADFYIFDDALPELLKRYNSISQSFFFDVGERRDGSFTLRCTPDCVEAHLAITPPWGGSSVTLEQIHQALRDKKITVGVRRAEIEAAVTSGRAQEILAARGRPPEPGTDGELVSLVPEIKERLPQCEDDDAIVDYRNLGDIISVDIGAPLMRRIPPVPGIPGESVMGKEIPPPAVKDVQFAPNLSGTELSAEDPNLLIAAIPGQPVLVPDGVTVEPVIKLKNVDLSSGNLSFIGSILVTGDITAGMTVKASGDISIGGVVEAARLEAGGSITVSGGIIGQGDVRNSRGELGAETAHVSAKGNVTALFVESAVVTAGTDITVQGFVMQSELAAGNRIVVGQEGSTKGHIIGGSCQAVNEILAATLGSPAGVHTLVSVGVDPAVREKFSTVKLKLQEKERELEELNKKLEYFASTPHKATPEQVEKSHLTREKLVTLVAELTGEKKRLQKRLERVANAQIRVEHAALSGVIISIGTKALQVDDDLGKSTFRLEDGEIAISA